MVQVNSDNNITGSERLNNYVSSTVSDSLSLYSDQVTSIQVHLGDENSHKGGEDDKRCMIEARLAGMNPVAVTAHAATIEQAINLAIDKILSALEKAVGRVKS